MPFESQAHFHALKARFKGFSGPVGSGKSKALCYEALRLSYHNPGRTGLLGAPTYRMLKDVTLPALLNIIREQCIPWTFSHTDHVITLLDNGSIIFLRSLANSDALRGTNLCWFGVDELTYTTEHSWHQLEARLRDPEATEYCGFGVWTPKGTDWVHRRFFATNTADYHAIIARPFENTHILRTNPRFYDVLKDSYCDSEYRKEVLGEYLTLAHNTVYASFDPAVHLTSTARSPTLPLLWAFDFNVDPMCSIVAQRDGDRLIILDELVLRRSGTEEMCLEFTNRYGDHPMTVKIYGDASGHARSTKGSSDYDIVRRMLSRYGMSSFALVVPRNNPRVADRVALVNGLLSAASGSIRLIIDTKCHELAKDLLELRFKEGTSIIDKHTDHDRSHLSDALGYLVWQEYSIKTPLGEQDRRLL